MNPMGLALAVFLSVAQTDTSTPPPASSPAPVPEIDNSPGAAAWAQLNDEGQKVAEALKARDLDTLKSVVPVAQADVATYISKYPNEKNSPSAHLVQVQLGTLARELKLPGAPTVDDTQKQLEVIYVDKKMPDGIRAQADLMEIAQLMQTAQTSKAPNAFDEIDKRIDGFEKDFGDLTLNGQSPTILSVRQEQIEIEKMTADPTHYNALLDKLATDSHPEIKDMVKQAKADETALAALKTKPLDLQFTGLDGKPVDISKMRGKVVLVDFWATWCPPCRGETPDVVAVYQKYHDKGFEIIGISLDKSQDELQKYITENKMPWPQYFDGKVWENSISSRFGIQSIPAMWLIGKDGMLVTQNGRDDLDGQVAKLLGAK